MKALTIWQPWASLIILGCKPYEFRGWPAHQSIIGQRIAIHAGARPVRKREIADLILRLKSDEAWATALHHDALPHLERWLTAPGSLWRAAVLGTAVLQEPFMNSERIAEEFGGILNDSDRDNHANWAWPLVDIEPYDPPREARGAQGFWNWNP